MISLSRSLPDIPIYDSRIRVEHVKSDDEENEATPTFAAPGAGKRTFEWVMQLECHPPLTQSMPDREPLLSRFSIDHEKFHSLKQIESAPGTMVQRLQDMSAYHHAQALRASQQEESPQARAHYSMALLFEGVLYCDDGASENHPSFDLHQDPSNGENLSPFAMKKRIRQFESAIVETLSEHPEIMSFPHETSYDDDAERDRIWNKFLLANGPIKYTRVANSSSKYAALMGSAAAIPLSCATSYGGLGMLLSSCHVAPISGLLGGIAATAALLAPCPAIAATAIGGYRLGAHIHDTMIMPEHPSLHPLVNLSMDTDRSF